MTAPKIEILTVNDDGDVHTVVFVDGRPVTPDNEVDIDPGAGWMREDWDGQVQDFTGSPAFVAACKEAHQCASESQFITD